MYFPQWNFGPKETNTLMRELHSPRKFWGTEPLLHARLGRGGFAGRSNLAGTFQYNNLRDARIPGSRPHRTLR